VEALGPPGSITANIRVSDDALSTHICPKSQNIGYFLQTAEYQIKKVQVESKRREGFCCLSETIFTLGIFGYTDV